jgi:hypothetical protein
MGSIADQSQSDLGGRLSMLTLQRRDHIRLDDLLRGLADASAPEQPRMLLDVYRLVFPHAFAEESVLWPAIRRVVPTGDQLTLQVEREHQQINELVSLFETMEPDNPDRQQVLDEVVALLRQDVSDEENELLPRLQAQLSRAQLRWLGVSWEMVRRIAPTRPHPSVSRRPPGDVLAALPLTLIDRCRDAVDARRFEVDRAPSPVLDALSGALTRLSHRVEGSPGFGLGEDLSTQRKSRSPSRAAALFGAATLVTAITLIGINRRGQEQVA